MNLGMFNRLCPSLKTRIQLKEIIDLSRGNRNEERYVLCIEFFFGLISGCKNL
jgi:hypothetical protein